MLRRLAQPYPVRIALNLLGKLFALTAYGVFAWVIYSMFTYFGMTPWLAAPIALGLIAFNVETKGTLWQMLVGWPRRAELPASTRGRGDIDAQQLP